MARQMSPRRRRVVVMAGGVAAVGGTIPVLTHGHPYTADCILGGMIVALIYIVREMFKLKRTGDCS